MKLVATMWEEEAGAILKPIVEQASRSILRTANKAALGSPRASAVESSPAKKSPSMSLLQDAANVVLPMLKCTAESKAKLSSAMQNLAHAAEYYLQVGSAASYFNIHFNVYFNYYFIVSLYQHHFNRLVS